MSKPASTSNDFGKVTELCENLATAFHPDTSFQATVTVLKAQWTNEWRYDLQFKGSFSKRDLDGIDAIAKQVDCYYELVGGTVNFSLSLPYKEFYDTRSRIHD